MSLVGGRACAFPPFCLLRLPEVSCPVSFPFLSCCAASCCLPRAFGPATSARTRPGRCWPGRPAGLVVLDIRTPEEFRDGHLPGARNLDFFAPDFRQQLEALAREDVPILLYCRSGNRSGQAMRLLRQWGRDDVLHLADGFRSWRAAGLPEE